MGSESKPAVWESLTEEHRRMLRVTTKTQLQEARVTAALSATKAKACIDAAKNAQAACDADAKRLEAVESLCKLIGVAT